MEVDKTRKHRYHASKKYLMYEFSNNLKSKNNDNAFYKTVTSTFPALRSYRFGSNIYLFLSPSDIVEKISYLWSSTKHVHPNTSPNPYPHPTHTRPPPPTLIQYPNNICFLISIRYIILQWTS